MRADRSSRRWLAAGGLFSLLVHVVGGLMAVAWTHETGGGKDATASSQDPLLKRQEPEVALGLQRSRSVSINWLGFETPTEHRAELAETEQPALSMTAPGRSDEVIASTIEGDGSSARAPLAPGEMAAAPGAVVGPPAPSESAAALVVTPKESEAAEIAAATEAGRLDLPPARDPLAGASGGGGGEQGAPSGGDDQPGAPSDRESIATALREAINLTDWGKPLAREGLEIKTVRPRWSVSTRIARSPRNPVVLISFGGSGAVAHAAFLRDGKFEYSTGYPDVDGPLLDAIYRWKAQGEAIEALEGDERVTISVRVVLRG